MSGDDPEFEIFESERQSLILRKFSVGLRPEEELRLTEVERIVEDRWPVYSDEELSRLQRMIDYLKDKEP